MAFLKFFSSHEETEPETAIEQETPVEPVIDPSKKTIVFLSHDDDHELWFQLARHLKLLEYRLPYLQWKYYMYPLPTTKEEENVHEEFMSNLQGALLFVPCTSALFLTRFWVACQKDHRLNNYLSRTQIQPIPLRAAHGVHQSILPKAFAAYAPGPERDEAAAAIVATLEEKLLWFLALAGQGQPEAPDLLLLEETTSKSRQLLLQ
jgi:hypothetical protein